MKVIRLIQLIAGVTATFSAMAADSQLLHSGPQQVHLLELYTSEGCSSCPPAERKLATLKDHPGLWDTLVPVALHVDYWDRLGWPDPYATATHTDRQRSFARAWKSRTVYTPAFVLDGKPLRQWSRITEALSPGEPTPVGELTATVTESETKITFTPVKSNPGRINVHIAWLGMNLSSKPDAGENRGRRLEHHFTALAYATKPMKAVEEGRYLETVPRPVSFADGALPSALAVWITLGRDPSPVQALGGVLE